MQEGESRIAITPIINIHSTSPARGGQLSASRASWRVRSMRIIQKVLRGFYASSTAGATADDKYCIRLDFLGAFGTYRPP